MSQRLIACCIFFVAALPAFADPSPEERIHRERIDERSIGMQDVSYVTYNQGGRPVEMVRTTRFVQGTRKVPLDGAKFYEAIDRPDLVAEYQSRGRHTTRLAAPGAAILAVAIGASLGVGLTDPHYHRNAAGDLGSPSVSLAHGLGAAAIGIGVGVAGLTLVVLAARTPLDPKTFAERRQLALEYNHRLAATPPRVVSDDGNED